MSFKNYLIGILSLFACAQSFCSELTLRQYLLTLKNAQPGNGYIYKYTIQNESGAQTIFSIYNNRILLRDLGNGKYAFGIHPHSSFLDTFPENTGNIVGKNYDLISQIIENQQPSLMNEAFLDETIVAGSIAELSENSINDSYVLITGRTVSEQ